MINYIQRKELNVRKYDACIEKAPNSRVYAFSWYLDAVADHWDALVLNDYEAVMPLPWRQKYFINYIYQPPWTQQLGVFSSNEISEEFILNFIKAVPKKFKKITIQFNSGNPLKGKNVTERVNYILPLDRPYRELFGKFRKDRRSRIRKNDSVISIQSGTHLASQSIVKIFKKEYQSKIEVSEENYRKLNMLLENRALNNKVNFEILIAKQKEEVIAGAIFLATNNSITYLFSAQTEKGRALNSLSAILNRVIENYSGSDKILDFEGSMIPGIADFFKSFGAEKEKYFLYQKSFKYFG